jgi:hypothetical protein
LPLVFINILVAVEFSIMCKLGRLRAGRRKARALLSLDPFLQLKTLIYPTQTSK